MNYVVSVIAAVYGALTLIASITGGKDGKKGDTAVMMVLGGCSLVTAAGLCAFGYSSDWWIALSGCVLISIAAFINGKRGEFHARHHVVRAVIEIVLVVGFILL